MGDPELDTATSEGDVGLNTETLPPAEVVEIAPSPEVMAEEGGRSEVAMAVLRGDPSLSGG